jgi:hypothetical protein
MPTTNVKNGGKIAVEEGTQIDNRLAIGQHPPKTSPADERNDHHQDRSLSSSQSEQGLLESILQAAEKGRHQQHTQRPKWRSSDGSGLLISGTTVPRDPARC